MIAAATALDEQFVAADNAGDGAALAALYADCPDTVSMAPDTMVSRGIALTETHHIALADAVISSGLWSRGLRPQSHLGGGVGHFPRAGGNRRNRSCCR